MDLTNFRFETDADGIATATWDMPDRSMNVITLEVIEELSRVVETVAADAGIKGCVVTSAKEAFSGGADLTMLQGLGALYEQLKREKGEEAAMQVFFDELLESTHFHSIGGIGRHAPDVLFTETEADCGFFN